MHRKYFRWLQERYGKAAVLSAFAEITLMLSAYLPVFSRKPDDFSICWSYSIAAGFLYSCTACILLSVILFSFVHSRSESDLVFSLPVTRKQLLVTNTAFILITSMAGFIIGSLLGWVMKAHLLISFMEMLSVWLMSVFGILTVILTTVMFYMLACTVSSGVIQVIAWNLLPLIAGIAQQYFVTEYLPDNHMVFQSLPPVCALSPVIAAGMNVAGLLPSFTSYAFSWWNVLISAVWILLAWIGLEKVFMNRKAETAEQIHTADPWMHALLNLYAAVLLLLLSLASARVFSIHASKKVLLFYPVLLVIYMLCSALYSHGKPHLKNILEFCCLAACTYVLALSGWKSRGFGLSEQYHQDDGKYLVYSYDVISEEGSVDDLVVLDSPEWKNAANVDVQIRIPLDQKDRYAEILNKLDAYRKSLIDNFYTQNQSERKYYGTFTVFNEDDQQVQYDYYSYTVMNRNTALDPEIFRQIEQMGGQVRIAHLNEGSEKYETLQEHLKEDLKS